MCSSDLIEEMFSVFEKSIWDQFEQEFLNFTKSVNNIDLADPVTLFDQNPVNITANLRNFQSLFTTLMGVTGQVNGQNDDDYFNNVIDGQYSNFMNTIRAFMEYDVILKNGIKGDIGLLSVDIDGNDFWILSSILTEYSPRVIMIETNVRFEPYESMAMKYIEDWRWDFGSWYGASPYAYKKLVNQYNYTPVHIHIDDMIIIRNDCLEETDINKDWLSIYNKSNKSLYNEHIRPGESSPVIELETEKWMQI